MKAIPSFLLVMREFIRKVEGMAIPPTLLLLSLDVVSLYTSIPHEDIRITIQETLESRDITHPPIHFLLDLVDILLEKVR